MGMWGAGVYSSGHNLQINKNDGSQNHRHWDFGNHWHNLKLLSHGQIAYLCKYLHICKYTHMNGFAHVCKICTICKFLKFAPDRDQVQISICIYANFAYVQVCPCERKSKCAYMSIYFNIHLHTSLRKSILIFSSKQSITGSLFWTEILTLYTYNVIISIKALKAMIKRDRTCIWVERHVSAHVLFLFSRESFETHPDCTKLTHSVFI